MGVTRCKVVVSQPRQINIKHISKGLIGGVEDFWVSLIFAG